MDPDNPFREIEPAAQNGPPPEPPPVYVEPPPVVSSPVVELAMFAPPEVVPPPPPVPPPGPVPRLLAGLESGIVGAAVMIGWFALDSMMERQYWWAMLNLWGASVYHNRVFSMGFGIATVTGAAAHLFLHGLGGALWSLVAAKMSNYWLHLACSFFAAWAWYWVLMHAFWPAVAPVVSRLSPLPATFLAYFLFGAALSRTARRARQLQSVCET